MLVYSKNTYSFTAKVPTVQYSMYTPSTSMRVRLREVARRAQRYWFDIISLGPYPTRIESNAARGLSRLLTPEPVSSPTDREENTRTKRSTRAELTEGREQLRAEGTGRGGMKRAIYAYEYMGERERWAVTGAQTRMKREQFLELLVPLDSGTTRAGVFWNYSCRWILELLEPVDSGTIQL